MTAVQRRNEIRKFCATFFSAVGIAGIVAALFSEPKPEPYLILGRFLAFIGGMAFFMLAYYIIQRLEESGV